MCTNSGLGALHRLFQLVLSINFQSSCCCLYFIDGVAPELGVSALRRDAHGHTPSGLILLCHMRAPPQVCCRLGRTCVAWGDGKMSFKAGLGGGRGKAGIDPAKVPKPIYHFLEAFTSSKISHFSSTLVLFCLIYKPFENSMPTMDSLTTGAHIHTTFSMQCQGVLGLSEKPMLWRFQFCFYSILSRRNEMFLRFGTFSFP